MKKRTFFLILGIVLALAAVGVLVRLFLVTYAPSAESESYAPVTDTTSVTIDRTTADEVQEDETVPYVSPVDFDSLQAINADIYGWIDIAGTNISYPVVQSADDDTFYLNHNTDGEYSANGSIFSEHEFNAMDFDTDPVIILYGHHMSSGDMFGQMQEYYLDPDFFAQDTPIMIYTPERAYEYHVFAAVPYSNEHILYYFDFTQEASFTAFFDAINDIRSLNAVFNEEYAPQYGDHVLILSTCLIGNNTQRFLVMATLTE